MSTRHDPRARRVEILRSAAAAFRKRGFHGASVEQIARSLSMTKGNLYYYFKDKEEILFFCHDYSIDILLDLLREAELRALPPDETMRGLVAAFARMIIDELHGTALTMDLAALSPPLQNKIIAKRDEVDRGIRKIIAAGIEQGQFAAGDPKLLSFAMLGAINWISRWFDPAGPASSEEIGRAFAEYLVRGLLVR
jgi:AcrR family transcriptional regulator